MFNRDRFALKRFVEAQKPVFDQVLAELTAGRKTSHWMWYIFPQIAGLGRSAQAQHYAIKSAEEAEAYLRHRTLGPRLIACTRAMLTHQGTDPAAILGTVDALKFQSSMTLFEAVSDDPVFAAALDGFFDGQRDAATLDLLAAA